LIGLQRDDRLLPVRAAADVPAGAPLLAVHRLRPHRRDLHREQRLDRALDVDLVGALVHLEVVLVPELPEHRALLGDQRAPYDASRVLHRAKTSFMRASPAEVSTTASQDNSSYGFRRSASVACTWRRLRHDFQTWSSCSPSTTSVRLAFKP